MAEAIHLLRIQDPAQHEVGAGVFHACPDTDVDSCQCKLRLIQGREGCPEPVTTASYGDSEHLASQPDPATCSTPMVLTRRLRSLKLSCNACGHWRGSSQPQSPPHGMVPEEGVITVIMTRSAEERAEVWHQADLQPDKL